MPGFPRKFKAGFGGREVRYGRYLLTYSKLRLRLAELAMASRADQVPGLTQLRQRTAAPPQMEPSDWLARQANYNGSYSGRLLEQVAMGFTANLSRCDFDRRSRTELPFTSQAITCRRLVTEHSCF